MSVSEQSVITLQHLIDSSSAIYGEALSQQLKQLLTTNTQLISKVALAEIPFKALRLDSRQVERGDVFILLKSQSANCQKSRDYIVQAAKQAAFILSEIDPVVLFDNTNLPYDSPITLSGNQSGAKQSVQLPNPLNCPVLYVPNIRDFLGDLIQARLQYQQLAALPTVVAVTGTNGKTTITQLVAQLTELAGMSSAVMGTAGNGKLGALIQASHTTGDALAVQQFLHQMASQNVEILALEASSHGLDQQRLQGVPIKVAIYTNLSRDHLDYHADMQEYVAAKAKLFDKAYFPALTHAIINADDEYAKVMIARAQASSLQVWTYSLQADSAHDAHIEATLIATEIKPSLEGADISLQSKIGLSKITAPDANAGLGSGFSISSPLLGRFNVANLLAAMLAAAALDIGMEQITKSIEQLQGAIGRMQRVPSSSGSFIVDYAHTPDALSQVLASLQTHCEGTLWAVFGCGGDRDAGKRPLMAQAGLAGADKVILTADNPRTEDPDVILQDMQVGMSAEQYQRTHIEPARQAAIEYAVRHAGDNDIVVIAGKGHETYQEINGVRYDFDDSLILQQALQQTSKR